MKNLLASFLVAATLLPAQQVRDSQPKHQTESLDAAVAEQISAASGRGWFAVAVYLPALPISEETAYIQHLKDAGYKIANGTSPNQVFVSWQK